MFLFFANIIALLFSFFVVGTMLGALFSKPFRDKLTELVLARRLALARSLHNPIITPGATPWSAEAVLNPAALSLGGRTHLLYRAIGGDGVSRLGYASSGNGYVFDDRPPYPVYVAANPHAAPDRLRRYSPLLYPSGGSWGGCEDPRMVAIDGRVYVTYNAFDGWDFIRVAFVSIHEDDFRAKRFWKWSNAKLLSRAGTLNKNWALFPEKIGGKFALLHNLHAEGPDRVRIEYVDDLYTYDPERSALESPDPNAMAPRRIAWHYRMRGVGPPPLRTDRGWLVFYHATSEGEGHRYKLGAMLLDPDDPTRVLRRAAAPVLSPDTPYENHGKPGIIYACGAVIRDGTVFVYYGGADKVVCVATAPLAPFLDALEEGEPSPLTSRSARVA